MLSLLLSREKFVSKMCLETLKQKTHQVIPQEKFINTIIFTTSLLYIVSKEKVSFLKVKVFPNNYAEMGHHI